MIDFRPDFNYWLYRENEKAITVYDNEIARATSIDEAVFIRRILYLWKKYEGEESIYIIPKKFTLPIGMTLYSFRKIVKKWEDLDLIETESKGVPLKKYYSPNKENIANYLNDLRSSLHLLESEKISSRIREDKFSNPRRYIIGINNNNNNNIIVKSGTAFPDSETNIVSSLSEEQEVLPKEGAQRPPVLRSSRKEKKIYEYVLERMNTLSEMKVLPKIRKVSPTRKSKIMTKIKKEPQMEFWKELFDKIESLSEYFSSVSWFHFDFLFVRADKIYSILEGKYDKSLEMDRKFNGAKNQIEDAGDVFESKRDQEILNDLVGLVSDKIVPASEKEEELIKIVEQVLDWEIPSLNNKILGKQLHGRANYHPSWTTDATKAYQRHIEQYAKKSKMPLCVKTICIGSQCWNEFEKKVSSTWEYLDEEQIKLLADN